MQARVLFKRNGFPNEFIFQYIIGCSKMLNLPKHKKKNNNNNNGKTKCNGYCSVAYAKESSLTLRETKGMVHSILDSRFLRTPPHL